MRGSTDFEDLAAIAGSSTRSLKNRRSAARIDFRKGNAQPLPDRRTGDYENISFPSRPAPSFLRKVFYTSVQITVDRASTRVRLYDDRLDLFLGSSYLASHAVARKRYRTAMWWITVT